MTDREIIRALWPEGQVLCVWKGGRLWKAKFASRLEKMNILLTNHYVDPLRDALKEVLYQDGDLIGDKSRKAIDAALKPLPDEA